jgi:hypothetical protein
LEFEELEIRQPCSDPEAHFADVLASEFPLGVDHKLKSRPFAQSVIGFENYGTTF